MCAIAVHEGANAGDLVKRLNEEPDVSIRWALILQPLPRSSQQPALAVLVARRKLCGYPCLRDLGLSARLRPHGAGSSPLNAALSIPILTPERLVKDFTILQRHRFLFERRHAALQEVRKRDEKSAVSSAVFVSLRTLLGTSTISIIRFNGSAVFDSSFRSDP
jgi:hypothetical protein